MLQDRLLLCFQSVFPGHSSDTLLSATPDTIEQWDSTRHFLLLQSVEEEFEVRIPEKIGGELQSFSEFEDYLRSKLPSA